MTPSPESPRYRVGVVSDTHWSRPDQVNPKLAHVLAGVQLIIHAGDLVEPFVLKHLSALAPTRAVLGNCDRAELASVLSPQLTLEIEGVRIGVLHGHQANPDEPEEYLELFRSPLDLLIHGHSHVAVNRIVQGTRIFNPGSASEPRNRLAPTVGLLEIEPGQGIVSLRHLDLATRKTITPI